MPASPLFPLQNEPMVRVRLFSDDREVGSEVVLVSATVRRAVNRAPVATLVFLDGDVVAQTFALSDAATFRPGADITLRAGYGDSDAVIFSGVVVRHGLRIGAGTGPSLEVDCRDEAKDSVVQVTDGTMPVLVPDAQEQADLRVAYGDSLIDFSADLDTRHPDPNAQPQPILRGKMRFQGSALARVGGLVALQGVGARFSGALWVSGLTHEIQDGNWITTVEFGPGKPVALADLYGNRVELGAEGITLNSPKGIRLSTRGSIALEAGGAVSIGAGADVKLEGMNVHCSAQVAMVAKGAATAELSASGQTTVKGAMVLIN